MQSPSESSDIPPAEVTNSLRRLGLIGPDEQPRYSRLAGGVSSDIWHVEGRHRQFCVKRALANLRVDAAWSAPVERGQYEVRWLTVVSDLVPNICPKVLGVDSGNRLFAMDYFDPGLFPQWKGQLRDERVDAGMAAAVGRLLGRIHAATAGREDIAAAFPSGVIFEAIRLEPYLRATALKHPDLALNLHALADRTASADHARALVHGDVSPKNILVGPDGPVFLDAECAWYGDPAFDAAFCLNHLLLKCVWVPNAAARFLGCFDALWGAYCAMVDWEAPDAIAARIATLLPGLLLARIDGKSPVEYIVTTSDKDRVRSVARALFARPVVRVDQVRAVWAREMCSG